MKDWLTKNRKWISSDSKKLIQEATLCYSIEANRAALLFSYLGLMTIIKERIIASKKPDSIAQDRWDNVLAELNDEDKWEKRVFDELVNSSSPIFNIPESIRQQVKYWKDRRNDCAHFKENEIHNGHVEIFWSFIKSNLAKITIEGGKNDLLKKFAIHFDETKTPPNADYMHLIGEIDTSVEITDSESFFQDLLNILENSYWYDDYKISTVILDLLGNLGNESIKASLIRLLKSKEDYDLILIANKSQFVNYLNYAPEDIREIWMTRVHRKSGKVKYWVYAALLQNGLIPPSQIKEAMELFYNTFNQEGFNNLPSDELFRNVLANSELLETIQLKLFDDGGIAQHEYSLINSKADLIELYIEYKELEGQDVQQICEMYGNGINPWWLTRNLVSLFSKKADLFENFKAICNENGYKLPSYLEPE